MKNFISKNLIQFSSSFNKRNLNTLHHSAQTGFTLSNISNYEKGRPSYSSKTIQMINKIIYEKYSKKSNCSLLEIGAGTGKFTTAYFNEITRFAWLKNCSYLALEPSDFVEYLKNLPLNIQVEKGYGENIPCSNESMDAVLIAQAFHWMDNEKCVREIHRVLKPGCPLILIWNGYDSNVDWMKQYEDQVIIPRYPPDTPRYQSGEWENILKSDVGKTLFSPIHKKYSRNQISGDISMVVNRALSTSVISNQTDEVKKQVQEQILTLVSTHPDTKDIPQNTTDGYVMKYQTLIAYVYKL